jgi:dihydrofolate reductase
MMNGRAGGARIHHSTLQVFVLAHHARAHLFMAGKTEFHFVTGGVDAALQHAAEVANGKDIRIGGATI